MTQARNKAIPARKRMAGYRDRMRAIGLRPVQIWMPDTRAAGFVAKCRRQARAVAAGDPAGDELMRFVDGVRDWPER
ncbi:MAG: antitoxin MazE family protein [Reyranella sp.]|nr:antitoxin MazE family protein [Reyranella sp.]